MLGAVLPFMTRMMTTGVYDVTNVGFDSVSVITNTTPMGVVVSNNGLAIRI